MICVCVYVCDLNWLVLYKKKGQVREDANNKPGRIKSGCTRDQPKYPTAMPQVNNYKLYKLVNYGGVDLTTIRLVGSD